MAMNDIESILGRLSRGISKLTDSDVRLLFFDIYKKLETLDAKTNCPSGGCEVPGKQDSTPGTGKRGRPRKSDAEGSDS